MLTTVLLVTNLKADLPAPGGPNAIGTTFQLLKDSARRDPVTGKGSRVLQVQFWYPTRSKNGKLAPYVLDPRLVDVMVKTEYYAQPKEALNSWKRLKTHAILNAPIAPKAKYPVICLMPGLGTSRINYTILCEGLASRGYFVAAIDPPHGSLTVQPDGQVWSSDDDKEYGDDDLSDKKGREWASDMSFLLDWLKTSAFASKVNTAKAGAIGHSSGGVAASWAPQIDLRFDAAINLDGMMSRAILDRGEPCPHTSHWEQSQLLGRGSRQARSNSCPVERAGRQGSNRSGESAKCAFRTHSRDRDQGYGTPQFQ